MKLRAYFHHRESIGSQVYVSGVLGECEHSPAWIKTVQRAPVHKRGWLVASNIAPNSIKVEVPLISSFIGSYQIAFKQASPFWTVNNPLEFDRDRWERSNHVYPSKLIKIFPQLSISIEEELVHGCTVETNEASHFVVVIASCCQGDFCSNSVTSKSGHGDFVFIHESNHIIYE